MLIPSMSSLQEGRSKTQPRKSVPAEVTSSKWKILMTLHEEHPGNTPTRPGEIRTDELERQRQQLIDDLAFLVVREHRRRCRQRGEAGKTPGKPDCSPGPGT
jgi:hypothetical protein